MRNQFFMTTSLASNSKAVGSKTKKQSDFKVSMRDGKPTILVVEDYADTREMMRLMLDMLGYYVIEAEDGAQAVKMTLEKHPDLILMDINMPIMDGFQASAQIRRQPGSANIPIIACTARNQWEWRNKAISAGCNDFMSKPLNFDELEIILHRHLDDLPVHK